MKKLLLIAAFLLPTIAFGATPALTVPQGGTASSTLTGILIGNGTSAIRSLTVGSGLNLSGTTLTGVAAFTYPFPSNATSTSIAFNGGLTGVLTGSLVGNASTATALAANGSNCSAGNSLLGVDASGASEGCFDVWTEAENTSAAYISSIIANSPLSGSGTSASHLTIANAAADGSTKGAASFTANDFDASSGNISLDYTNGQKASGSQPGFLSSTDWTTFNSKSSFAYPFPSNATSTSIAFNGGLTGVLTGSVVGNSSTATALAANGANCSAGNAPLGVDASGASENCFDVWTEAENTSAAYLSSITADAPLTGSGTSASHLTIPASSVTANGYLSSANFQVFNNKVGTGTSETAGQLAVWNTTSGTPAKLYSLATTTVTASSPLAFSNPVVKIGGSNSVLSLDTSGTWSGNAGTATALAANGANCSAGNFPLGVDASGAVENCTALPTTISGTANQIAASAATGAVTLSIPTDFRVTSTTISGATLLTNATTTSFAVKDLVSCDTIDTDSTGSFRCGTDASGGGGVWPFTTSDTNYGVAVQSTTTPEWFKNGVFASSTSYFANSSSTLSTVLSTLWVGTPGTKAAATADSITQYGPSSYEWTQGYDLTDDTFAIASGTVLGTNNALKIDKALKVTLGGALTVTGATTLATSLTGVLTAASGVVSTGVDGTDFTLINANTCTNQLFSAVTAAGVFTCSSVSNAMLTNSSITVNGTSVSLGGSVTVASTTLLADFNTWTNRQNFALASSTQFSAASETFYINSTGKVVAKDTTNNWSGRLSPTRAFVLETSTTTTWTATTSGAYVPYLTMPFAGTLRDVRCTASTTQAFLGIAPRIAGVKTAPSYFVASTTVGQIIFSSANTFTIGQRIDIYAGTTTSDANATGVSCTFTATET